MGLMAQPLLARETEEDPRKVGEEPVETDTRNQGWTWNSLENSARDRGKWRSLVGALCAEQPLED